MGGGGGRGGQGVKGWRGGAGEKLRSTLGPYLDRGEGVASEAITGDVADGTLVGEDADP